MLLMIQGHTFTALAREDALQGLWLRLHGLLHGLTAPMFLVGGGLAYGIVSRRRREADEVQRAQVRPPPARWDRRMVRRAGLLLVMGTLLQVPQAPLGSWLTYPGLLARLSAVGPLQLVGACLIMCEALHVLCATRRRFLAALAALSALLSALAPWVWQARLSERLGAPLGMWLDGHGGSQFPLLPWGVFFLVGVLAGQGLPAERRAAPRFGWRLLGLGVASACVLAALYRAGLLSHEQARDFWSASPLYVAFRGALVFAWLGLLVAVMPAVERVRRVLPRLAELADVLARRSLVAYVVHLFWLYGSPLTQGLAQLGRRFDLLGVFAIFAGVALHTAAVCVLWERYPPERVFAAARKLAQVAREGADSPGLR